MDARVPRAEGTRKAHALTVERGASLASLSNLSRSLSARALPPATGGGWRGEGDFLPRQTALRVSFAEAQPHLLGDSAELVRRRPRDGPAVIGSLRAHGRPFFVRRERGRQRKSVHAFVEGRPRLRGDSAGFYTSRRLPSGLQGALVSAPESFDVAGHGAGRSARRYADSAPGSVASALPVRARAPLRRASPTWLGSLSRLRN